MELAEESPLCFLLGAWQGEGGGDPGEGSGGFTFALNLQSSVIVRTNYAVYSATSERSAFRHDDLMVIYTNPVSSRPRAMYFDSEGHVIAYDVEQASGSPVVRFTSDVLPDSPRYRLTYTPTGPESLSLTFEIAAPGQPDSFSLYLSARAHREPAS